MRTPKFKPGDAVRVSMPFGADEVVDGIVVAYKIVWGGGVKYAVSIGGEWLHEVPEIALLTTPEVANG